MTTLSHARNPWPAAIIGFFVTFILGAVVFIAWAVHQDMDLVRKDYYEEEIRFQNRLDGLNRTQPLRAEVAVTYDAARSRVEIALPASHARQQVTGRVHFYRPSDARLDYEVPLVVEADGTQRVDAKPLRRGLWKVHLSWLANGVEYYFDQRVIVGDN